ncbi:MAG: SIMPL domain-containing protein [archaeon]|jgi:hypothetical protein
MKECCEGHKPIGAILAVFVVIALLLAGIGYLVGTNANNEMTVNVPTGSGADLRNILSVSGTVEKMVSPDQVEITLGVVTIKKTAADSQSANATEATAVMDALKVVGLQTSEIKTFGYSVTEEYQYNDSTKKSELIGYRTTNNIMIKTNRINDAGKIIDAATIAGANSVSGITFTLSDTKQSETKLVALTEASAVAKQKAQVMATGMSVTLGKVTSISENSYYYTPNYRSYDMASGSVAKEVSTPITPGDVSVSATISVGYEIK